MIRNKVTTVFKHFGLLKWLLYLYQYNDIVIVTLFNVLPVTVDNTNKETSL